jgi:hypothetical protein
MRNLGIAVFLLACVLHAEFALHDGDRIVIYGDSITAGSDYPNYVRYLETYVRLHYPDADIRLWNRGWSGDTAANFTRFERDCLALDPTVITINMGMNDAGYTPLIGAKLTTFLANIERFVAVARQRNPRVRIYLVSRGVPKEEWAQLLWQPDGKPPVWAENQTPCPFNPVGQEEKRERLRALVNPIKQHPAFKYVCMYDEIGGRQNISPAAVANFKKETGLTQVPDFQPRPAGSILPDNDPMVKWIDTFSMDCVWMTMGLGMEDRVLTEELHAIAPGAKTFSTPTSGMGYADYESSEIYPYLIESPTQRFLGAPELIGESIIDSYNIAQRVEPRKPQWPLLGWYNLPGAPEFNESLRMLMELCLAKGARGIGIAPDTWVRNRPDMIATMRELVDFSDRYGAMLGGLRFTGLRRVAVLYQQYQNLTSSNPSYFGNSNYNMILPVLRAHGIPAELVSVDEVLAGLLDACDAVILVSYSAITQSLNEKIQAFAQRGGLVVADEISAPALLPPGTVRLPWQTNLGYAKDVAALREPLLNIFAPTMPSWAVHSNQFNLVPYYAEGKDSRVYFVINADLYQTQQTELSALGTDGVLYDLLTGRPVPTQVKDGRLTWSSIVEKGNWRIYVRRASPISQVELTAQANGTRVTVSVRVLDQNKQPAADVPLEVSILDATGQPTPYGSCLATDAQGLAKTEFTVASLTDKPGSWRVSATELLSGRQAKTAKVSVHVQN